MPIDDSHKRCSVSLSGKPDCSPWPGCREIPFQFHAYFHSGGGPFLDWRGSFLFSPFSLLCYVALLRLMSFACTLSQNAYTVYCFWWYETKMKGKKVLTNPRHQPQASKGVEKGCTWPRGEQAINAFQRPSAVRLGLGAIEELSPLLIHTMNTSAQVDKRVAHFSAYSVWHPRQGKHFLWKTFLNV